MASSLKASQVTGEARRLLLEGGFSSAPHIRIPAPGENRDDEYPFDDIDSSLEAGKLNDSPARDLQVFEDRFSVVGMIYYSSWYELESNWRRAQAALVECISEHIRRLEPKAWDGYLMLFTLDERAPAAAVDEINHDTRRLRKLVATGRELNNMAAIERALLPVLPLRMDHAHGERHDLIDRLPSLLEELGLNPAMAQAAVSAFRENRSPMEGIWSWRKSQ